MRLALAQSMVLHRLWLIGQHDLAREMVGFGASNLWDIVTTCNKALQQERSGNGTDVDVPDLAKRWAAPTVPKWGRPHQSAPEAIAAVTQWLCAGGNNGKLMLQLRTKGTELASAIRTALDASPPPLWELAPEFERAAQALEAAQALVTPLLRAHEALARQVEARLDLLAGLQLAPQPVERQCEPGCYRAERGETPHRGRCTFTGALGCPIPGAGSCDLRAGHDGECDR